MASATAVDTKVVVASAKAKAPTGPLASSKEEAEQLPLIAKIINHVLTPGSSLSGMMLVIFNIILFLLFTIWLMFVYVMPTSWIVWTFGFLGGGLGVSTNFLLYQILFIVEEPKIEEEAKEGGENQKVIQSGEEEAKEKVSEPEVVAPAAANNKNNSSATDREGSLRKRKAKKEN